MITLTPQEWLGLLTHLKKWVSNLRRASKQRKLESKSALRDVIKAVRKTTVYTRSLQQYRKTSLEQDSELSLLWTELSFKLDDLGLNKLAKRCHITGIYWSDPSQLDRDFLDKAEVGLSDIERLAKLNLQELN
ncbi:MAG: hypothetical protein COA95_01845 [Methylophaga sp.]|nr:MAG: hypothetical protein COA95_01845 [Methylophaga sp.]